MSRCLLGVLGAFRSPELNLGFCLEGSRTDLDSARGLHAGLGGSIDVSTVVQLGRGSQNRLGYWVPGAPVRIHVDHVSIIAAGGAVVNS